MKGGYNVAGKGAFFEKEFKLPRSYKHVTLEAIIYSIDSFDHEHIMVDLNGSKIFDQQYVWNGSNR